MSGPLHVEIVGDGPPVVLLHGWAMHGGIWGPWLDRLAARHRLHVVDLPGHGRSSAVALTSLDAAVDDVAASVPSGAAVVGWSLGALVALAWARRAPTAVPRLVLIAATPRFVATPEWPHGIADAVLERFTDELALAYRRTLQRFLTLQLQGTDHGRRTLAHLRHALLARGEPSRASLRAGLALLRDSDLRGALPAIAAPALVIAGDRDTLAPAAASRFVAAALPHAELLVIDGAGHVPFLSHPDLVAESVERFLDA